MKPSGNWGAFGLALAAALANAVFATAQKKVTGVANPFYFLIFSSTVSLFIWLVFSCFFPPVSAWTYLRQNGLWIGVGGAGFALLSVCIYQLFSQYGASYYTLYAMLAILTTSILAGVLLFGERYNGYTLLSIGCAGLSIIFFYLSKTR